MSCSKNRVHRYTKIPFQAIGVIVLILLAVALFWNNNVNSNQAVGAVAAKVYFDGEYKIGDGQWKDIEEGEHIPATKGDVTLKGNFHLLSPDGEYIGIAKGTVPIALYTDHINVEIRESGFDPYIIDSENPLYGVSACGVDWTAFLFKSDGTAPIEIIVHNYHSFGNETAIDKLLSNVAIWGNIEFEREILDSEKLQQNLGLFFVIVALVLLGIALFSALLHSQFSRIICIFGLTIIFAGAYIAYSTSSVPFWSESITGNTTILGASMIFYMLLVSGIVVYFLKKSKKIAIAATAILGIADGLFFLIPLLTDVYFYDTWMFWTIAQTIVNLVLVSCLVFEFISADSRRRWLYIGMTLLIAAFEADVVATGLGFWKGGFLSEYVFFVLFVSALVVVLRIIPVNINSAVKAKELELQRSRLEAEKNMIEAELKESRISIMLSQIQPHFIYNTLGTIERMCLKDPEKAFDLVRNFSLYLRGNFSELDSVTPIRFTDEIKHVEYYANIEKVRFPDMTISYELETTDFVIPALSVQPLVENAIKHGLMRLESGGTVLIHSYETPTHFCVEVKDDGVGFDVSLQLDSKSHIGLRNIRGRLKAMVNGELIIESKEGAGTKALIIIPKEVTI